MPINEVHDPGQIRFGDSGGPGREFLAFGVKGVFAVVSARVFLALEAPEAHCLCAQPIVRHILT